MNRDEDRLAVSLRQIGEQIDERHRVVGGEAARRLVEEQERRIGDELERDVDALPLSAGEHFALGLSDLEILHGLEAEVLHHLLDAPIDLGVAEIGREAELSRVLDRFEDRELGVDDVVLRHVSDAAAERVVDGIEALAVDAHLAARRAQITIEHGEQRGLSGAARAHQGDEIAGQRLERHVIEQDALRVRALPICDGEEQIERLDLDLVAAPLGALLLDVGADRAALDDEHHRVGADEDALAGLHLHRLAWGDAAPVDARAVRAAEIGDDERAVARDADARVPHRDLRIREHDVGRRRAADHGLLLLRQPLELLDVDGAEHRARPRGGRRVRVALHGDRRVLFEQARRADGGRRRAHHARRADGGRRRAHHAGRADGGRRRAHRARRRDRRR